MTTLVFAIPPIDPLTFVVRRSAFVVHRSAFVVRRSAFGVLALMAIITACA
jgi:hypothetical protein